jgi:hypothetical protein
MRASTTTLSSLLENATDEDLEVAVRDAHLPSLLVTLAHLTGDTSILKTHLRPQLPGADRFQGESWHTAQWNHNVDLAGKRVAVIGTGASAFQIIPPLAETTSELTIFQRTPAWVLPTPGYNKKLTVGLRWLFKNVPHYNRWYRFNEFWAKVGGIREFAVVDPTGGTPYQCLGRTRRSGSSWSNSSANPSRIGQIF